MNLNKEKTMENIAYNVLYLRKINNLSKSQMAKKLGIGLNTLTKIEKRILPRRLSARFLFRIKDVFGVPVSLIVSEKIDKERTK